MMFLHTKPCSSARLCMVNVKTMGGRRSRHWCGPGPVRETNNGPCSEGYQAMGYPKFSKSKRKMNGIERLNRS
jgi:hypothetical protein